MPMSEKDRLFGPAKLGDSVARATVSFLFEGHIVVAREGETVAAALLANGAGHFRTTPVGAQPRAAYCMMGVCFECLVTIDGRPNRQACMTTVADGMTVARQQGANSA